RRLADRKHEHAGVVAVIHEVLNRIQTWLSWTRISGRRTAARRRSFSGSIVNLISRIFAATLKCVKQSEPMSHFVRGGIAFVIWNGGTSGKCRVPYHHTIDAIRDIPGPPCPS